MWENATEGGGGRANATTPPRHDLYDRYGQPYSYPKSCGADGAVVSTTVATTPSPTASLSPDISPVGVGEWQSPQQQQQQQQYQRISSCSCAGPFFCCPAHSPPLHPPPAQPQQQQQQQQPQWHGQPLQQQQQQQQTQWHGQPQQPQAVQQTIGVSIGSHAAASITVMTPQPMRPDLRLTPMNIGAWGGATKLFGGAAHEDAADDDGSGYSSSTGRDESDDSNDSGGDDRGGALALSKYTWAKELQAPLRSRVDGVLGDMDIQRWIGRAVEEMKEGERNVGETKVGIGLSTIPCCRSPSPRM